MKGQRLHRTRSGITANRPSCSSAYVGLRGGGVSKASASIAAS